MGDLQREKPPLAGGGSADWQPWQAAHVGATTSQRRKEVRSMSVPSTTPNHHVDQATGLVRVVLVTSVVTA